MPVDVKTDAELKRLIEILEKLKSDQRTDFTIAKAMPLLSSLSRDDIRQADLDASIGTIKKEFNILIGSVISGS